MNHIGADADAEGMVVLQGEPAAIKAAALAVFNSAPLPPIRRFRCGEQTQKFAPRRSIERYRPERRRSRHSRSGQSPSLARSPLRRGRARPAEQRTDIDEWRRRIAGHGSVITQAPRSKRTPDYRVNQAAIGG
jgi:hypothetical protein